MLVSSQYGLGALPAIDPGIYTVSPGDITQTTSTDAAAQAALNALINAGYTDSSVSVDPNTGLPLYVRSGTNPNPTANPCGPGGESFGQCPSKPLSLTTIGLIGGGVLLLVLAMSGGRRR
jgi:hypothetical protein